MKKNNEQFKKLLRVSLVGLLMLAETIVFSYVWLAEYNEYIVVPFVQKGNWLFFVVYAILFLIFLNSFDGMQYGTYRKTNLVTAQLLATLSTTFVVYLQIVLLSAQFVTVIPLLLMLLADAAIILLVALLSEVLFQKIFPPRKTLVVYDSYDPEVFMQKLRQRPDKFRVEKMIHISDTEELAKFEKIVSDFECVVIYDVHSETRNKLLKTCFEKNIRAYSTTKVSDSLIRGAERLHMFDTPLLLYRNAGLTIGQRILKRTFDILVSLFLLILSSPFLLISAIAIKCYDGGRVFFRQARSTIDGKVFFIHKFRSMIENAEKDGLSHPAEERDPRITPVGRVLRATRLDELPQLIDILKGDMSLVGPRPERIEHTEQYSKEIPEFVYRLKVRGGLTGYAQLYGKYNTSPYDKLQLDLMYIQNYSFFLDLKLILMTIKIMFMKESTEGFTKEKSSEITKKDQETKEK